MVERPFQDYIERHGDPRLARFESAVGVRARNIALARRVISASFSGEILHHEYERDGDFAFVHKSTYYPGAFRWTSFDERGFKGHEDGFETEEDAFFDMLRSGYVHPAFGVLPVAMRTEVWKRGQERQKLLDLHNRMTAQGKWKEARAVWDKILRLP